MYSELLKSYLTLTKPRLFTCNPTLSRSYLHLTFLLTFSHAFWSFNMIPDLSTFLDILTCYLTFLNISRHSLMLLSWRTAALWSEKIRMGDHPNFQTCSFFYTSLLTLTFDYCLFLCTCNCSFLSVTRPDMVSDLFHTLSDLTYYLSYYM